jgi:exopolysaccharide biosynthesis polyprenyl glycosylphosphotransferase
VSAATEPAKASSPRSGTPALSALSSASFGPDDSLLSELLTSSTARASWGWRLLRSSGIILVVDVIAIAVGINVMDHFDKATIAYLVLVPAWLALLGSYRPRITLSVQTDLVSLLGALACPMLVLAWIHTPTAVGLLHDVPVATAFVLGGRLLSYSVRRRARAKTITSEPTLIVGSGVLGCKVAEALLEHPEYGMLPVGFLDGFPDDGRLPLPVLGDIDNFDDVVRRTSAIRVIIAFGANRETELVEVLRKSVEAHVEVHIIPRLFEIGVTPAGPDADIVWGFPLQHARRAALRTPAWRTKRAMDLTVAGLVLVILSPVLALAALAVRLSSPGPILFRQRRLGQRNEVVEIYKFRSMRVNADADVRWGGKVDDRITTIGKVLRATSIDELPQLFNVLKGDMSLVGPRPERPHFADQFAHQFIRYSDRVRVPVGLTGWAQVHGLRGDTSIEDRVRFDNYYIEHWSLWFDITIVARTIWYIVLDPFRRSSTD